MFATIRRHQKWLWFVVIAFVIVSFVIYLDPSYSVRGGGGSGRSPGSMGYLNGRAITYEEFMDAYAEARLQFFMYAQSWPEQSENTRRLFNADRQVTERLISLEKIREWNIHVPDEAVADWIAQVFRDRESGTFNLELYRQFVERGLRQGQLTEADFRRFARHEVALRHLFSLGGLPGGLLTPREAELQFRREQEQVTAEVALFSLSNHLALVEVNPDRLNTFFTNQIARYTLPEKIRVSYVRFAYTNFLAEADLRLAQQTNLDLQIETLYRQRGAGSFRDASGLVMTPEAAKAQLKREQREAIAALEAQRRAGRFSEELYSLYEKSPGQLDNLERLAAASGLTAAVTDPFGRFERPPGLTVGGEFAAAAFQLSTNQPMAMEVIPSPTAAYVIAFKELLPRRAQLLEEVRDTVVADFRRSEARQAAVDAANRFHSAVTNQLAQGKNFAAVCAEGGVPVLQPAPISRATQTLPALGDQVELSQLKGLALDMPVGKVSDVEETRDGAIVVHVVRRQPVDSARVKSELPGFMERLREEAQQEAANEWFRRELELAQISGVPRLERSTETPAP